MERYSVERLENVQNLGVLWRGDHDWLFTTGPFLVEVKS